MATSARCMPKITCMQSHHFLVSAPDACTGYMTCTRSGHRACPSMSTSSTAYKHRCMLLFGAAQA
eukprot:360894-Chlamydomonas_euryale.AAC.5